MSDFVLRQTDWTSGLPFHPDHAERHKPVIPDMTTPKRETVLSQSNTYTLSVSNIRKVRKISM